MRTFLLHVLRNDVFRDRTRRWTKCAINVSGEQNSLDLLVDPKRFDTLWLSASAAAGCRVACIRAHMPRRTRSSSAGLGTRTCPEDRLCSTLPDSLFCGRGRRSVISIECTICNCREISCWQHCNRRHFWKGYRLNVANVCWRYY